MFGHRWLVSGVLCLPLACADGSEADALTVESVTTIPAGDGQGDAASGEYDVELYTSHCEGSCSIHAPLWTVTFCDVGDRDEEDFVAVQHDGALQIDGDDGNYVSRLRGGIDADGSFDVGGHGTDYGGELQSTARVRGDIDTSGAITAVAEVHVWGHAEDDDVDCWGTYEVEGQRD